MIMKMQLLMSPLSPVCLILTIIFRFDSFNKLNKTKQNKKERKKSQFKWKEKAEKKLYFSNCVYYEQRNFFFLTITCQTCTFSLPKILLSSN